MIYDPSRNAKKPGAATPGLKRFALWLLVALSSYGIGFAGAIVGMPFPPLALVSAGFGCLMFRGGRL